MTFVEYTTREGDRWDLISEMAYGDPWQFGRIIKENRHVPIRPVLDAGIKIYIPVIESTVTTSTDLPPWKRGAE